MLQWMSGTGFLWFCSVMCPSVKNEGGLSVTATAKLWGAVGELEEEQ